MFTADDSNNTQIICLSVKIYRNMGNVKLYTINGREKRTPLISSSRIQNYINVYNQVKALLWSWQMLKSFNRLLLLLMFQKPKWHHVIKVDGSVCHLHKRQHNTHIGKTPHQVNCDTATALPINNLSIFLDAGRPTGNLCQINILSDVVLMSVAVCQK